MEIDRKTILIIGCGSIGSRYLKLLSELNFFVRGYDKKKIKIIPKLKNFNFLKTVEACINSNPDFIIIATPPNAHLSSLKIAIKTKAKILLEKPLAGNKDDAKAILKIAKKNRRRIWCVANMRYHPAFQIIEKNIKKLGKIYFVNSHFSHKLSQMRNLGTNVFAAKKNGGGVVLDCVHDIDLLSRLFGKLSFVNSWTGTIGHEKIVSEDYANLWLSSKNVKRISMNFDFLSRWKSRGIKIVGERGTLIWESGGRNPEQVSVKIFGTDSLISSFLKNKTIHHNAMYREMLIDFTNKCKKLQSVEEASEILNLALNAR
jgi:predicted dehydrogenase